MKTATVVSIMFAALYIQALIQGAIFFAAISAGISIYMAFLATNVRTIRRHRR